MNKTSITDHRGISPPMTRPTRLIVLRRLVPIALGHLLPREGSDGFVPVMLAATLIAAAILLALD